MPVDKIKYLGACIRTARKHCGLTQQELADQSGVSVKTIRNIETGKMNPSYEILFPLSTAWGCPQVICLMYPQTSRRKKSSASSENSGPAIGQTSLSFWGLWIIWQSSYWLSRINPI